MTDKHEWRKKEKHLYLPKNKPEIVDVPDFKFITICGAGNPNSQHFSDCIGALYSVAYAIKMLLKKQEVKPVGYFDYTVYPLEGVWDINEEAKKTFNGTVNKDDFVYEIMIRQPDFIDEVYFTECLDVVKNKKPSPLLEQLNFETIHEGQCVQMLHLGEYENEPASFEQMEIFATEHGLNRESKVHREIYLSDARKVAPDKLKTVLRFKTN
jgi:hypothetical protein